MPEITILAPPLTPPREVRRLRDALLARLPTLRAVSRERVPSLPDDPPPCQVFVLLGGGTEAQVVKVLAESAGRPAVPVALVAHPTNNSLAASLEVLAWLCQQKRPARLFLVRDGATEPAELVTWIAHARAWERLRRSRIGLVGGPSPWLVASSPDPDLLRDRWGPQVVPIEPSEVLEEKARVPDLEVMAGATDVARRARALQDLQVADLFDAVRIWKAMEQVVESQGLNALSVRCFDLLDQAGSTACLAHALLPAKGIVAGCEGDLPGVLTLLWLQVVLDRYGFLANPQDVDVEAGDLWLAHCTLPLDAPVPFTLRPHFETGKGVALAGEWEEGDATVVRIGGRDLDELFLAEGRIVGDPSREGRCRTQVRVHLGDAVQELLERPRGNHLVLVRGHHAEALRTWHRDLLPGT